MGEGGCLGEGAPGGRVGRGGAAAGLGGKGDLVGAGGDPLRDPTQRGGDGVGVKPHLAGLGNGGHAATGPADRHCNSVRISRTAWWA